MRRWIVLWIVGLVCLVGATEGQAAFRGQVVDADTKEPIEGVVVFMEWSYVQFSLMPHSHAFGDAYETVTDNEGRFSLPQWWSFNPWKMAFKRNSLTIFKSGYIPIKGTDWGAFLEAEWGALKGELIWKMENGQPVILLRKLSDRDRDKMIFDMGLIAPGPNVPEEKQRLLRREMNKERE